jgi:DNA-binding protein Fis
MIKNITKEVNNLVSIAQTVNLKKAAVPFYDILPSWCFPERQLRFKAYCVGMAKTGTTSIHAIFNSAQYRSAHEPEATFLIPKILAFVKGKIDRNQLTRYVKHRDRRLGLEMDSSHINYYLIDILVREFGEAKFILTIRDCYSWLDSLIDAQLRPPKTWLIQRRRVDMNSVRFQANNQHVKEEQILADNGKYTLDSYFKYWNEHNSKVLATVPEDRLLIVKTTEINQSIRQIEEFLGIPRGTLPNQVQKNVTRKKNNILSQIDKNFLEEKANFHCKELMDKYFPEIRGFNS